MVKQKNPDVIQVQFEGLVEGSQTQVDKFKKLLEKLVKLNDGVLAIRKE